MPKNLRFACILLTLCLAALISLTRPSVGKLKVIGSAGQAAASVGDCAIRQVSDIRPAASLSQIGGDDLLPMHTASWQLAGQGAAQEPAGADGQATQASTANSLAADVTVTDHKMTAGPLPANCVTPLARYNFTPTDEQAYQWLLVSGANVGDVVRWEFVQPSGAVYFQTQTAPITFSGNACFSASVFIAGRAAATLPGAWQTRVFYNGALLLTENFTIGPAGGPVTVTDHKMTGGPIPDNCVAPAAKSTFAPTDAFAYQWLALNGIRMGDVIRWEFIQPNGALYRASEFRVDFTGSTGCFWANIAIAGQAAASLPGNWQVRVLFNTALLLTENFTIAADACPTVTGLSATRGAVGSVVTITGTNFTGVSAVKFTNNVAAQITANTGTQLTVTVPAGATTGPLTISKPNCADVQTAIFTVPPQPRIDVMPASLAFGSVAVGQSKDLQLTVRNTGSAPLNIASITSSDPQFTISLPTTTFALPANGSININVRFAPTTAGAKTGTLSINSNDPSRPRVDVAMTGTGLAPAIDVSPAGLNFGQVRLAETKDLVLTIRNTGAAPLRISSITSSNPQFSVTQFIERPSGALRNLPLSIAPNTSVEVTVRFRPSFVAASVGALSGVLSINSNDPNRPRVDVPLTGTGVGALIGAPSSLSFGGVTVCLATPTSATLTLTNTGNAPLTVAALAIDNPAFALTPRPALPLVIAPGASVNVNLSFYTRATGTQTGRLVISSNAVNNPGLSVALTGVGTPIAPPAISQITVSRTTLSHGRADTARPVSPFNPFGLADVIGFVFPGGPLPANSIAPGIVPPPLIGGFPGLPAAAVPSAPDPFHITLAGGTANPIVVSAANIPSCFTLAVAEGVTAPDVTRWERIGTRFGSGNLYAAVSIPGTSIFAGMELVTEADLNAYTANSIIYEAPAFGLIVAPAGQNGGAVPLQARARRIPTDPQCQTVLSAPQSTSVEYSRTVRVEIPSNGIVVTRSGGGFRVEVTAQIFGNFDPAINTVIRFAYDGNTTDLVDDVDETINPPGAPRITTHAFDVPATEECNLARIIVVASSTGNVPFAPPPINPFLEIAPDTIGLFTFRSGGCTVEDSKAALVTVPDSNCSGGVPSAWIQGTVTDATTGQPIAGATVSAAGISAITSDDGSYALNNVPVGQQTLNASADGFVPAQIAVTVIGGQVLTRNIALRPQTGALSGFVINAFNGQPIAGAAVTVKGTNISATTGGDGSYTLTGLPAGAQTVIASAANYNSAEATIIALADQAITQDFFLAPTVGAITGTVRNATTNQPIAGATVTAGGVTTTTGASGAYTLNNVPAGAQTLSASATDFNPASLGVTVLAGQTVTQDIALAPQLGTVAGTVRDETLQPIAGATVTLGGATTTTGADGAYTFNNVPVGAQTITASATNFRAASATATVVANQTTTQDFTLTRLTGSIRGRITNAVTGQPIANADIDLLPFPLTFATSDAGGNYTMTDVPTGPQVILATAQGYYAKLAVVTVTADQTVTQDFALTPQVGTVTGIVFDNFSQPVIGATLAVAGTNIAAVTDADGRYTLSNVPVGTQTLNVSATGLRSAQATVNVVANETIYKDIYLQTPTGTVRGTVRNAANNQPIAGAAILVGIPFGAVYYSAFTDANGNYVLNDIPAGRLTIYAGADGFIAAQATTTVVANQTTTQDFALTPDTGATTGIITGVVRNAANNQPVSGVVITVAGTNLSTTSGGDGSYTLSNVPAGAQTINASRSGFRTATVQVTVAAGQTVTQDIALTPGVGTVTGVVRNAATGQPLSGATVTVAGTNISATSGADGSFTLSNVPAGAQTLNASANGFIATQVQVTVTDGQTVTQNISLSPTLQQGEIRITLNWSKDGEGRPRDLDAHLIGPNPDGSCFHVSFSNTGNLASPPFAQLEVDNIRISGAPPTETIRLSRLSPGIYRFYVNNYSGARSENDPAGLSRSQATVQVFGTGGLLGSFTVPSGTGFDWTVFELNGQTGALTTINQLASPASNCR